MRRRDFLATAGTLLSAGCGGLMGGNQQQQRSGGPKKRMYRGGVGDVNRSIDNDVGDINNSDISIDADINTSSLDTNVSIDPTDDVDLLLGDDDEGTATPANERTTRLVGEATTKLNEAISIYTSFAGEDAGLMDVSATTTGFRKIEIQSKVREALSRLDDAVSSATEGQLVNIAALEEVGVFLSNAAAAQEALVLAYDRLEFATERFYGESLLLMENATRELRQHKDDAIQAVERIREETEDDSMQVLSTVSPRLYREKERRLGDQAEAFDSFSNGLEEMRTGMEEMQEAVPQYLDEEYDEAENAFLSASASFGIGATSFSLLLGAEPLEPKADEVYGVVSTLEQAADDLHRSANAQVNDNRLIFYEARRAAEAHVDSNEIVRNMRTMNDL